MTFDQLFNKVYSSEKKPISEDSNQTTVAMPEDFDDVKPAPVPETTKSSESQDSSENNQTSSVSIPTASTLKDYVFQLEDFAEKLNGMEGNSLQSLVSSLDRPGTPFDGISSRTKSEIVRVSETLLSISEKLKSFIINAIRK